MKVELTRFRVKPGKSKRVDDWMEYFRLNMDDIQINLDDENTFVESIFREEFYGEEYIYWYSVKSNKENESDKEPYLDPTHLRFMDECIDKTYRPEDMNAEVNMIKRDISQVMI
ncbi:DUF6176 family protein [Aliicoccus persicus]|uniref:NIPSNAP protein n=1 Tax=Aliicoccus persicus TaxID=930138 RepID=A0A662Z277_9STAP|nr:DUF6176 family protein [Aliicoccus persicus]SEV93390.1 hypothetical protein SAMN05192557_0859 [Aliicoccus persicus]